jgi:hypothetical protein
MPGAAYSASQLAFVALVSLVLYGAFIFVQTVKHRDYFLDATHEQIVAAAEHDAQVTSRASIPGTLLALLASLGAVVLLAKSLAPTLTAALDAVGAPDAATGVFIAAIVLLPESLAAYRAAVLNRLQTSLNLALGSALASIGLTIPAVAALSLAMGWTLELGLGQRSVRVEPIGRQGPHHGAARGGAPCAVRRVFVHDDRPLKSALAQRVGEMRTEQRDETLVDPRRGSDDVAALGVFAA